MPTTKEELLKWFPEDVEYIESLGQEYFDQHDGNKDNDSRYSFYH